MAAYLVYLPIILSECIELNFLFDIDGTLTPPRQRIEPSFSKFFQNWIRSHRTYLVSGSDYPKLVEQLDSEILEKVEMVFSSSGNVAHKEGREIFRKEWNYPKHLTQYLEEILQSNSYPLRSGNHIEFRPGMINFSIVGRMCSLEQRYAYYEYDLHKKEREQICNDIMKKFPGIHASIGGQISIDIYREGSNKSQIIKHITGSIHFFGDRIEPGGNDYDLVVALQNLSHKVIGVKNWLETYDFLKKI